MSGSYVLMASLLFSLKFDPFADLFLILALHVCGGLRRRGANMSVDMSLFALCTSTS